MTAHVRRIAGFAAMAAWLLGAAGCSHSVLVKSQPMGATVFVNKAEVGVTPVEFDEDGGSREQVYRIRLEKDGYLPKEYLLTPVEKASVFGCFLFSRGAFNLPDELEFNLYPAAPTQP